MSVPTLPLRAAPCAVRLEPRPEAASRAPCVHVGAHLLVPRPGAVPAGATRGKATVNSPPACRFQFSSSRTHLLLFTYQGP